MRGIPFGLGQLSSDEKNDILNQHKSLYNGYQTMQPEVSNTQPLYVYDNAMDKEGLVVNNKGEVKKYTNMGINEQSKFSVKNMLKEELQNEVCDDCGAMEMDEANNMCECGGEMYEGECSECGWKMEEIDEETGHLDDIYDEEDLNPNAGFDYIEGPSNDIDTFEGMHKNLYKEDDYDSSDWESAEPSGTEDGVDDPENEDDGDEDINASEVTDSEMEKGKKYKYKTPSFEDELEYEDEFKDKLGSSAPMFKFKGKNASGHMLSKKDIERFLTAMDEGSGLADYLDTDDQPGYDFKSGGPDEFGDDTYSEKADDMDLDDEDVRPAFDFESEGPGMGSAYPVNEYDEMESAWADDEIEEGVNSPAYKGPEGYDDSCDCYPDEIDEVDISGVQGIYGAMDPAYDFDSEGPGKAGPYQEFSYESEDKDGDDYEEDELKVDFDKFDPRTKSWEEIKAHTGDNEWSEIDEDLQESFINQKNKITEMFNRFNKYN
jgi:hypothetical protein